MIRYETTIASLEDMFALVHYTKLQERPKADSVLRRYSRQMSNCFESIMNSVYVQFTRLF